MKTPNKPTSILMFIKAIMDSIFVKDGDQQQPNRDHSDPIATKCPLSYHSTKLAAMAPSNKLWTEF